MLTVREEFGDYQTPEQFADDVCAWLKTEMNLRPDIIIEPTCGKGNFISSSLTFQPERVYGIEINPDYCAISRSRFSGRNVNIIQADCFQFDFQKLCFTGKRVLVLGNPPWATNSSLSASGSHNLPAKANFKGRGGLDALTGSSNFDICENIIMRMLDICQGMEAVVAMLCKTSVARSIFCECRRRQIAMASCDILTFDAKRVFGVSAAACLLVIDLRCTGFGTNICAVHPFEDKFAPREEYTYRNGDLIPVRSGNTADFSGTCSFQWRQGIKHDCAKVMEFSVRAGKLQNGLGESADLEPDYLFPLVKSSMFKSPVIQDYSKYVLVTQQKIGEDTSHIAKDAPRTWSYLTAHRDFFERRKSIIYRNASAFAIFGVGDYSYAQYKVGVSGFYKTPVFSLLAARDGIPVMTDDTSYFLSFEDYDMAYTAMLVLNSEPVQTFLMQIAFLDAKRPYTKKVLSRIDFRKIFCHIHSEDLKHTERSMNLPPYFRSQMLSVFQQLPEMLPESHQQTLF